MFEDDLLRISHSYKPNRKEVVTYLHHTVEMNPIIYYAIPSVVG